jgi:hypothetical protein
MEANWLYRANLELDVLVVPNAGFMVDAGDFDRAQPRHGLSCDFEILWMPFDSHGRQSNGFRGGDR